MAIGDHNGSDSKGRTRLFKYSDSSWNQVGDDILGDSVYDNFGSSLSLEETCFAIEHGWVHLQKWRE